MLLPRRKLVLSRRALLKRSLLAAPALILPKQASAQLQLLGAGANQPGGGFGPPPYVASAVATTFATNLQQISSLADSPLVTVSMWANIPSSFAGQFPELLQAAPPWVFQIGFNFNSDDTLFVQDTTSVDSFTFGSDDGAFTAGSWHHLFMACDTNHAAGLKIGFMYQDGASVLNPANTVDTNAAFSLGWNGNGINVAANALTPAQEIDFCDIQVWVGQLIDPSVPANLAKFISGGKPVNPATAAAAFGTQTYLFSGDATGFLVNQGTGGAFTASGTFTNAATHP